ncbi:CRISPR-associated helicase/endonuclease Cas3 [Hippea alviniae]|uniref:CRISPR-associated helicase/endonuclease Cas3 n=1 Tax=Hippea alviniae TaxID=1279027 RepID=UPI0003B70706|nr:CRISPR-associated helicase/endonuclease Cas3 [Hippea alviniae]
MSCYSHPNKKLIEHLKNVKDIGLLAFNEKLLDIPEEFNTVLTTSLYYHDFAKATKFFQDYLKSSIESKTCKHPSNLTSHSLLSACLGAYKIYTQLSKAEKPFLWTILGFIAVKKHHGNLENLENMVIVSKNDWRNLKKQWQNIECEFKEETKNLSFENIKKLIEDLFWQKDNIQNNIDTFFIFNFLFSLLTYADKTEVVVGKIAKNTLPSNIDTFIDTYKEKTFSNQKPNKLNLLREKAYKTVYENLLKSNTQKILSLNLPTGAGKTLIVLNVAFKLCREDKTLQRVIYALPFTSIVDQTEKVIKDVLKKNNCNPDDFITVHHHLTEARIKTDENYIEGDKAQLLIENWDKPLVLTTFWQLFHSIISNENSHLRKFHNISNSVIILDEVQSIPYKYWHLTNVVLKKLTELLNCKIIFLTATMPLIFDKEELYPLISDDVRDEFFSAFSRYKILTLKGLENLTIDELVEIVKNDIEHNPNKSFLFVFNTINTSVKFYRLLKEILPQKEFIYLSSNILPVDGKKRIDAIRDNPEGKIIISTQVVEAGVDIDIDVVYRDFAPLDSIIQTAGRCNRNNRQKMGIVKLFKLKNEKEKYDFGYIYKGLPLNATNELFKDIEEVEENKMLKLIDGYFHKVKENKSNNESNKIISAMKKLKYEDVSKEFKLIDEIPSFSMFFEIDDRATDLLDRFCKIMEIENRFERKNELLKIRSQFYQYVLSVKITNSTKSYFMDLEEIGGIKIVRKDLVNNIYDKETGLVREISIFI